jgi:lipoprotein-releasing system permease protein
MNTSIYIARRYLLSSKKMHAVNIISGISMLGVLIGTAAMIILLSVFNGLEKVIVSLNSNFSPALKIEARMGKTFDPRTPFFNSLRHDSRVFSYTEELQDKVVIQYRNKTYIGRIKGVSDDFLKNPRLDSAIIEGRFSLYTGNTPTAVIGVIIHNNLMINVGNSDFPMQIFSPRRGKVNSINPTDEFITRNIYPSGVFSIQQEDDDMMIVPIAFTRELFEQPYNVSSIDINLKKGVDLASVQDELRAKLDKEFTVKTRQEQNTALYRTLSYEKWAMFMILAFVVVIAAFNIIGSLTILVIDKRKDIAILTSLGAGKNLIQGIFFFEGLMISVIGCVVGLVLGWVFCILQQAFGLIPVEGMSVPNNAYPVAIKGSDFVMVFFTVMAISVIASAISATLSIKGLDDIKQDL